MFQTGVVEKITKHIFNNCLPKIVPFFEVMWKNMVQLDMLHRAM